LRALILARFRAVREPPSNTILFIPLSGNYCNPDFDWAAASGEPIVRFCPKCLCDTIIGHGRRRKQAHDESHDWIETRRGFCAQCEATFTFLPIFSLPYTHYSLIARSQALRRYFLEHGSWESAVPHLQDPDRVPDPSTLRRWFHSLDSSRPAFSFLRPALETMAPWLTRRATRVRFLTLVLADPVSVSASLLAPAPLRVNEIFLLPHHPCLGTGAQSS